MLHANEAYPHLALESNSSLSAAEHLELAAVALERQAARIVSGSRARKLQGIAEIFVGLALQLDSITSQREPI